MNILITGAGSVMGQSIYKALTMHDFSEKIEVHFSNSELIGAGRYFNHPSVKVVCAPIFPLAVDSDYESHLEEYIRINNIDIVFSGTQHELAKISKYRDKFGNAATIPSNIAEICMDKVQTAAILSKYGVRVPLTCTLKDYVNNHLNDQHCVVVKPNHSSSSRKIFVNNSREDVLRLLDENTLNQDGFLVQEQLYGDEYTCGCYIDRYTKDMNHIIFKRTLTPDGATSYGEIVVDDSITDYLKSVCNALVEEGLDFGHVNVQLILTDNGPVLFEINGRLSSTEASKAYYGFNSCAAFIYNIVKEESYTGWSVASSGRFLRYYEELYFN
ncbi:TPA: ATP-grasp domain-containing protein [Aeromonas veronii]|uniref:ATP-grasp domain-containing protein n=1 Tax=Aeromonas TaxID=642 RepID=UPI0021E7C513|nr:ATP-grasp domain-containing protein [Aeromonas veronii]MCV3285897.1 ATP-grasp domain-containing protein [Aeromonas veronii]